MFIEEYRPPLHEGIRVTIANPRVYKGVVAIDIFTEVSDAALIRPARYLLDCIASDPNRNLLIENALGQTVPLTKPLLYGPGRGRLIVPSLHTHTYEELLDGARWLSSIVWVSSDTTLRADQLTLTIRKQDELRESLAAIEPHRIEPVQFAIRRYQPIDSAP